MLAQEGGQAGGIPADTAAIHPQQIGGIRGDDRDLGEILGDEAADILLVLIHIGAHGIQPGTALLEGSRRGKSAQNAGLAHLIGIQGAPHPMAQRGIGYDHGGGLDPRQIEGLGRRDTGDADLRRLRGNAGIGDVLLAGVRQVAVDLVRQHQDAVLDTQLRDAQQSFPVPDLAHGIVGVAQDQQRGLGIGQGCLQRLKVDVVNRITIAQGALQHIAAIVDNGVEKDIVRRCEDHNFFGGAG